MSKCEKENKKMRGFSMFLKVLCTGTLTHHFENFSKNI